MNWQALEEEEMLCDACKHRKDSHMEDFWCWNTDGLAYYQCQKVIKK